MTENFNKMMKVFIAIPPGSGSTMIFDAIKKSDRFVFPQPVNGKDESSKIATMIDQDCLPEPDLYDDRQRSKYNSKKSLNLKRAGRLFGLYLEELSSEPRNFAKYLEILESQTSFDETNSFVEKSPSGSIWAKELSDYLDSEKSNYRFILGLRNPVSFIDRTLRSVVENFPDLSRRELIQMCIKNWVNIAELQAKNIEEIQNNVIFFTYEDALQNTSSVQDRLTKFLGIKITIPGVISDNNDKTYRALAGDEIVRQELKSLISEKRQLLERFNYYDTVLTFLNGS